MRTFAFIAGLLGVLAQPAMSSVTVVADLLERSDDADLAPDGVLVVDILVDVSPDDVWTAAGIRVTTTGPHRLRYAIDPNTNEPQLLNPGTEDRFVTCLSRPRPRDGDARFLNSGAAWAGRYCPTGPSVTATPTELNVVWFSSPPPNSSSPSVDGAIARVAVDVVPGPQDCDPGLCCRAVLYPGSSVPSIVVQVARIECIDPPGNAGLVAASFDDSSPDGANWVIGLDRYGGHPFPDVNTDGVVDLDDIAALLASFGLCEGQPGYDRRANVAGGPCVDIQDLSALLSHFGEVYCFN